MLKKKFPMANEVFDENPKDFLRLKVEKVLPNTMMIDDAKSMKNFEMKSMKNENFSIQ